MNVNQQRSLVYLKIYNRREKPKAVGKVFKDNFIKETKSFLGRN